MVGDAFIACLIVTIFLALIYVFKRLYGINILQEGSRMQRPNPKPPVIGAVSVNNPFSLVLQNSSQTKSSRESVHLLIDAKQDCSLRSFWNVDLNQALEERTKDVPFQGNQKNAESHLTRCLIQNSQRFSSPTFLNACTGDPYSHICQLEDDTRQTGSLDRNDDIRKINNLVVALELPRETRERAILNEDIVCMLTVIEENLKTNGTLYEWKIGYQIIQTASDKIFTLKNLYASGVPDLEAAAAPTFDATQQELCIICHACPVTRALLPCRHQCICGACFPRTKLCPICRKLITSCLVIADETNLPLPIPDEEELQQQTRDGLNSMGAWELIKAIWNAS